MDKTVRSEPNVSGFSFAFWAENASNVDVFPFRSRFTNSGNWKYGSKPSEYNTIRSSEWTRTVPIL